jgi:hypothetical protein
VKSETDEHREWVVILGGRSDALLQIPVCMALNPHRGELRRRVRRLGFRVKRGKCLFSSLKY